MKTIDFFCASQASTAVDQPSSSPAAAASGRAIDRHNPIIADGRRSNFTSRTTFPNPPCSSQYSPINPLPYHQLHAAAASPNVAADQIRSGASATHKGLKMKKKKKNSSIITTDFVRWSCAKPSDLATPPGSMRYLLNDKSVRDGSMDRLSTSIQLNKKVNSPNEIPQLSKPTAEISLEDDCKKSPPSNQVVVLRVSLHCRGCEGKLRKHLSKMEGVNSFNIDFAAKKVTIMGNITPEGMLESVSKVKNAQFWPYADPTPTPNPNPIHQQNVLKKA
ncbi:protein SODIUM POTASSIUM ROOT DEFECTIVE 3-like isoform X2 [Benincasa hispida]|uniref:protein SODIUM POTASSIUM ROOT DEFECTIVE 3-like isoform X2 n=1 Tax=Benincasa hispida TaxID=102211 RepID=UPI0019028653|nr:protein SODIUM POTASSIUM ROOT DEFECTIVE 3-like isoform X2 [Benincasa hispida]